MAYQNKLARLGSSSRQYRRKAGGNFPFISGKSSKDSKGNYFTDAPFDDPGMPEIGAVSRFRANAKQELDNSQGEFNRKVW